MNINKGNIDVHAQEVLSMIRFSVVHFFYEFGMVWDYGVVGNWLKRSVTLEKATLLNILCINSRNISGIRKLENGNNKKILYEVQTQQN